MQLEVRIERLGTQGDGIAQGPAGRLYVPFTLPGELARVEAESGSEQATLRAIVERSPERVEPICPHFGVCGGCALQHMEIGAYLAWKREQVVAALKSRGLDVPVEPVRPLPLASRRRATFALSRIRQGLALGYHAAGSHAIVPIEVCPVLEPRIEASLPKLKAALAPLLGKKEARVMVTETETGLDVVVEGGRLSPRLLTSLAAEMRELGAVRLTVDGETAVLLAEPVVDLSGAAVKLPPGAFLQASREAEAAMVNLVRQGVGRAKRVADLFAGIGTFTFALAGSAAVDAFEAEETAVQALSQAARAAAKLKPIRAYARDLFRAPLGPKEIALYDAVVLDPPRAGAEAQAEALAGSRVPKIVMVSCNPGTCARDLRILVDGGYRIRSVTPVDQFLFSPHIELVAVLEHQSVK
jgi:23S rRNA (uracil1939-C5)-methyltransferase